MLESAAGANHPVALLRRAQAYEATAQYAKAARDLETLKSSGGEAGEDFGALQSRLRTHTARDPLGLPALPSRAPPSSSAPSGAAATTQPPPPPPMSRPQWLKCVLGEDTRLLSFPLEGGLPALRAAVARKWPEETGALVIRALAPPGAPPPAAQPGGLATSEQLNETILPFLQLNRIPKLRLVRPGEEGEPELDNGLLDEWILDFASLVREHLGIDAEAHLEAASAGMNACSAAIHEGAGRGMTSADAAEAAQPLFDLSASKFQDAAALALFNWGNVHMCVARKRMAPPKAEKGAEGAPPPPPPPPPPPLAAETVAEVEALLEAAEARFKAAEAVKPDFHDIKIAFAEHRYERARLLAAVPGREDEADALFAESCTRFGAAVAAMPEETPAAAAAEGKAAPAAEGDLVEPEPSLRAQVMVMWGNVLYEHSQSRVRAGRGGWEALLDEAVLKFGAAGCAPADVEAALAAHAGRIAQAAAAAAK